MLKNKGENMVYQHSKIIIEIEIIPKSTKNSPYFSLLLKHILVLIYQG